MVKTKLKCTIVDDSAMQRMAVSKLIENHPNLTFLSEYRNGMEALKGIAHDKPDLVFLDVEMPLINGFDVLESLENLPEIIVISGKPDYAMKAFDFDVTDYLLKPIVQTRFNAAVQKVLLKSKEYLKEQDENYIFVNSNLRKVKVQLNSIKWVEALGDYIKVVTDDTNLLVLSTMKAFHKNLPEVQFLRIHKSYIINLQKVEKFTSTSVEIFGRELPLSRKRNLDLEKALQDT